MRQTWCDIVWCHWAVPPEQVQEILPTGLVPDLFDGVAWVGLIPFSMKDLRLPGPLGALSRLLRLDHFGEVNVRTYVKGPDARTGVWFCTLDSDHWLAVKTANIAFGLPYRFATTRLDRSRDSLTWVSRRHGDHARAELEVRVSAEEPRSAQPGLEEFLVERYALYTTWRGMLFRGELRHERWQVQPATLERVLTETVSAAGFLMKDEPHVMVGGPVEVSIFPLQRMKIPR